MEAIVKKLGNSFSIVIPEDFQSQYHLRERMVFDIIAEKEEIILTPKNKSVREQLSDEFDSINLEEFEKYKRETLSSLLNIPLQGMEFIDEE